MDRRQILKYVALSTGAAVSLPLVSTVMSGCGSAGTDSASTGGLAYFNSTEFSIIKDLVDIILPKTDSPSATEVNVHEMIDIMVGTAYRPKEKEDYTEKFQAFFSYIMDEGYEGMDSDEKVSLLNGLDQSSDAKMANASKGYLNLKQQTIAYYLSSEEVGTKFLNYLPIPGEYEPCISLEDAGNKAWTL